MPIRVNLLNDEEIRQFDAVNKRMIIFGSAAGVGGVLLVLFLVLGIKAVNAKREMAYLNERWAAAEVPYNKALKISLKASEQQQILKELTGWSESRFDWKAVLSGLQGVVPANVQLTRMNIRGAAKDRAVDLGEAGKRQEISRYYDLTIAGNASGELADEVIVQFLRHLRESPDFSEMIDTIKLQGMRRGAGQKENDDRREFSLEGVSKARVVL